MLLTVIVFLNAQGGCDYYIFEILSLEAIAAWIGAVEQSLCVKFTDVRNDDSVIENEECARTNSNG